MLQKQTQNFKYQKYLRGLFEERQSLVDLTVVVVDGAERNAGVAVARALNCVNCFQKMKMKL